MHQVNKTNSGANLYRKYEFQLSVMAALHSAALLVLPRRNECFAEILNCNFAGSADAAEFLRKYGNNYYFGTQIHAFRRKLLFHIKSVEFKHFILIPLGTFPISLKIIWSTFCNFTKIVKC